MFFIIIIIIKTNGNATLIVFKKTAGPLSHKCCFKLY
jgi:hypothetical protein